MGITGPRQSIKVNKAYKKRIINKAEVVFSGITRDDGRDTRKGQKCLCYSIITGISGLLNMEPAIGFEPMTF